MKGFTLVETVIVVGLTALILTAIANLFYIYYQVNGTDLAYRSAGSAGSAMAAISAAVVPADGVLTSHAFSGTTYTTGSTTLVLELPAIDSSGVIIASTYDYIAFYTSGTTLYRIIATGAGSSRTAGTKTLTTALANLTFSYNNADPSQATTVTADLRTSATYKQQSAGERVREAIKMRNL